MALKRNICLLDWQAGRPLECFSGSCHKLSCEVTLAIYNMTGMWKFPIYYAIEKTYLSLIVIGSNFICDLSKDIVLINGEENHPIPQVKTFCCKINWLVLIRWNINAMIFCLMQIFLNIMAAVNGYSVNRDPQQYVTQWDQSIIATISLTTFSNAFSCMRNCEFRKRFHWILFLRL